MSFSDLPISVDIPVPARRRLILGEANSWIEAIIANKDETRLTDCLPENAAQTFVDVIQEVCFHASGMVWSSFAPSVSVLPLGFGPSRSPATGPEKMVERFVSCMQPPDFTSQISPNPT